MHTWTSPDPCTICHPHALLPLLRRGCWHGWRRLLAAAGCWHGWPCSVLALTLLRHAPLAQKPRLALQLAAPLLVPALALLRLVPLPPTPHLATQLVLPQPLLAPAQLLLAALACIPHESADA